MPRLGWRLDRMPGHQRLLWISLREMHPGAVIHKLFQTLVECPAHRILPARHRTKLRRQHHAIEVHPVDAEHIQRPLQVVLEERVFADRIAGRYTCANCGAGYHDENLKPKVEGVCDKCGSTHFKRRPDDNRETVRTRLQAYYKETSPLIGYYHAKGKLHSVDGMGEIDAVTGEIEAILAKL